MKETMRNAYQGTFTAQNILSVSEVGLVVDDVVGIVHTLQSTLGLEVYQDMAENFAPLGDEHGLFIVVKRDRIWLASDKHSDVYPTGKLGQTSTDFEVKHRNSARNLGIDHSWPEKTAPQADVCAPFL